MINNIINYYMCIFFFFYGCKHLGIFLSSRIVFYGNMSAESLMCRYGADWVNAMFDIIITNASMWRCIPERVNRIVFIMPC